MTTAGDSVVRPPTRLAELAALFLKLGTIGFGGPAAHIALMEDEVVHRRKWLAREAFLDYVGAMNLIPGPNSTELAIAIGRERAGWAGLVVAGVSFIVPAAVIVTVVAWAYVRFGQLPSALAVLAGVKPVVIAIVAQALWRLGRTALSNRWLVLLAIVAAIATFVGVHELMVLLGAAVIAAASRVRRPGVGASAFSIIPVHGLSKPAVSGVAALGVTATSAITVSLLSVFAIFLKIGSVLFGSGYVLLAFLRADLVQRLRWITEQQLLDAVAVGQVTPGPVFTTATFIGYVLAGIPGAAVATIGIFLPAFVFVAVSGPLIPRIRRSRIAGAGLDGVNAASLALMAVVTWHLGRAVFVDTTSVVIALVALALLATRRVNAVWLLLGAAIVGIWVGAKN